MLVIFVILVCIVLAFTIVVSLYLDKKTNQNYLVTKQNLADDVDVLFKEKE